ncbi:tetrahydrofolate synthase OS=Tsukamurella paurometabola (strain ATCC 8368 / DSM / CCUG 35730/ CIP 100753 / JCM 10117 / KCTC 9821 / NBRC 16120 / NCIMB 702349/ NCTC 13040) OX=521096 GN=Tpau_1469 PE=4 SV=1 [Tsukamurella paurometabola]|uniref:Dihydrofolate synthase/folylpolyglutamate synthase n=1 Tax=Tsukamurella paurometabola (strain ATCC 8368 / DSM 20162 / CCUG 35730 / CIP 100753 / JCM 10117 / KCTC 9821 / NBRC 16120 / NCIMB 702349 / NCTC 13040) TaxID=521096 RepID=D5UXK4_TSUPD|nr:folylpolyglutamate synthase/dihydrofolate synthase family protein [Tsukamurella paurometabola]ADG78096.1 FolC bifunctional protein [Tsukamurella paurometabola DSM 20162]SUP30160.1 Folylpolyglutamate synthase [Tsukamurella paurometabola]
MTVPAFAADPDDLADLAQVEAELDQRWPETKIEPSLARISALMQLLGSPQDAYPSIQIAGTNGKSSTARMIDSLLLAFSRRTGRITSPHLQLATERIAIDGVPLTAKQYVETYRELEPYIELVDQQSEAADGPRMSKFEVLTAMAFAAFAEAPVDVAVVEVGLGGTWDATNVVTAEVAVITPIGLDHVEILGPDLTSIAGEKAGIVKRAPERLIPKDTVMIVGKQEPAAMDVLLHKAVETDAAVAREGSEFAVIERRMAVGGQQLSLQGLGGVYEDIFLPLHGEHQANNAATALAAVEAFFGAGADQQLDVDTVREGFATVISPGRLERVRTAPTVFIDAAHNPHGAQALARTVQSEFDFRTLIGVVSVFADKDAVGILTEIEPVLDTVVVTHNGSPRALEVERLAAIAEEIFGEDRVVTAPTMVDAVETAVALADQESDDEDPASGVGVLITGSVVTAGAARSLFGKEPQ